ncbi:MAG: aldo/keto reductase [Flavobacteriales bacterium]|nr:aldo/keto reductase [Flavobacteriales bacterium]
MKYNKLGKSGLEVSEISFGSWVTFGNQIDEKTAEKCMTEAYKCGVNFFDNAEVYASGMSETVMGKILKKQKWSRDSFVVSSKVFWGGKGPNQKGLSRKRVMEACHAALKRLQVDYLDLYFCHRPDDATPVEETVRSMHTLIEQGKVLYWGTSEWNAQQIMEAYSIARQYNLTPPTMEQPQYNMLVRERFENEYRRLYREIGLGTTIWSPLASGVLSGKYKNGKVPKGARLSLESLQWLKEKMLTKENIQKIEQLEVLSKKIGITTAQLAIAWCLKNENVSTVITGASKIEQVKENLKSIQVKEKITSEVMEEIEKILQNKPQILTF